ncbi:MAG TPA: hypothetical protein VFY48_00930 [Solirubrobacterales bacterium]|nr:hypothetical protein [Solirubrobacterales bacterium]
MKTRFAAIFGVALLAGLLTAGSLSAAMVGIYRNVMETKAQRSQMIKLSGASCGRAGAGGALRITIGKRTDACALRTPVLGRDLEIAATERLLSGTPPALQKKAYLGLELRAGGGAKYQLLAFPLQRKVQLVKVTEAGTEFLAIEKNVKALMGVNKANALRLRAVNSEPGKARVFAYLGGALVTEAQDETAGELAGRASAVTIGAVNGGNGVIGSIDDVIIRTRVLFK